MFATIRAALSKHLPAVNRSVGGYYPNVPKSLWEFDLTENQEHTLVWESSDATVRCVRTDGRWAAVLEGDGFSRSAEFDEFHDALAKAYYFITSTSSQSNLPSID